MKTLLLSLLIFLSVGLKAQNPIVIDSILPNPACFNDTVTCYMHSVGTCTSCNLFTIETVPQNLTVYSDHSPTNTAVVDSGFVVRFRITSNFMVGNQQLYCPNGHTSGVNYTLVINNCYAGIENYNSKEDLIITEYFNLLGQPISKPYGITIEVKTYLGGLKEVRKIITPVE